MIRSIFIKPKAHAYLVSHNLLDRFIKSAQKITEGNNRGVDLKSQKPKSKNIWQFRITKKYRAFARKKGDTLTVYEIDDHQYMVPREGIEPSLPEGTRF